SVYLPHMPEACHSGPTLGGSARQAANDRLERGPYLLGLETNLRMREPEGGQSGGGVRLIPLAIACLLGRSAVVAQTVRLHDQTQVGPEEIDPEAVEANTGLGRRQSEIANQPEKSPLELGIGQAVDLAIKKSRQGADARLSAYFFQPAAQ